MIYVGYSHKELSLLQHNVKNTHGLWVLYKAGRAGFEPANEVLCPVNRLAGGPNQPLWHLPK